MQKRWNGGQHQALKGTGVMGDKCGWRWRNEQMGKAARTAAIQWHKGGSGIGKKGGAKHEAGNEEKRGGVERKNFSLADGGEMHSE